MTVQVNQFRLSRIWLFYPKWIYFTQLYFPFYLFLWFSIEDLNLDDKLIEQTVFVIEDGKIVIEHENKEVLKYMIS